MKTLRNRDQRGQAQIVTRAKMLKKHWFYKQNLKNKNGHVFEWSRFDTISPRFHFCGHDFVFCNFVCFVIAIGIAHANTHLT